MEWTEIAALVATALLGLGGTYLFVVKGKIKEVKALLEELLESLEDDKLTKEEIKAIVEKAKAIFVKQPTEEK